MPSPSYATSRAMASAAATMRSRSGAGSEGLGATSTSFWKRRCSVHSRSPRDITSRPSPSTCTSIWSAPAISHST